MAKYVHVALHLPSQCALLLIHAKKVLAALTDNPNFLGLAPLLPGLADKILGLDEAMTGTAAARCAAREALKEELMHLADDVQAVAETSTGTTDLSAIRALVKSAEMDLRKATGRPRAVFAAKYGPVQGSVDLTAPRSRHREPHEWQFSIDQLTWIAVTPTLQASTRVTGLAIGVPHHFRHRLLTKTGYTEWSDPTVMIVVR
jgi:hypothetical protein